MKQVTHKPGRHDSGFRLSRITPLPWFFLKRRFLSLNVQFQEESKYTLPGEDQGDWNKVGGINAQVWKPSNKNSAMLAWRYNPVSDLFELTAYANVGGQNKYNSFIVGVPAGDWVHCEIEFPARNMMSLSLYVQVAGGAWNLAGYEEWEYPVHIRAAAVIGPWFGGNNPAPKEIQYLLDSGFRRRNQTNMRPPQKLAAWSIYNTLRSCSQVLRRPAGVFSHFYKPVSISANE